MVREKDNLPEPDKFIFQCNETEYSSDHNFIREKGVGRSRNESNAHRIADLDASVNLARAVDKYLKKISTINPNDQLHKDSLAHGGHYPFSDVNMMLAGITTICSETSIDGDFFLVRIIVEIPIENVIPKADTPL